MAGLDSQTDALWRQFAQVHQQLVQMKAKDGHERQPTLERERDAARTDRDDDDDNQDQAARQRQQRQQRQQQQQQARQQVGREGDGDRAEQLQERLAQLLGQIIERDVAQATGRQELLRPETPARPGVQPGAPQRPIERDDE